MNKFRLGTTTAEHGHLTTHESFLLDPDSLTTHALILGQTGSGKTGMGISLLEEAAIAGVPCIAVDPKGDLGNLLLQFPDNRVEDYAPWCENPGEAADAWKDGLGSDRKRSIELLRSSDLKIYTPGSTRGNPLAIIGDLPPPSVEGEDLHRLIQTETIGLLDLAGVKCDPISGAEALLLSTLIERSWARGSTLELGELVRQVAKPPIQKIGALSLEAACPKRKRKALAQKLNAMISSPAMRSWSAGENLEIGSFLRAEDGRPRTSILSIAHLGDEERMFFLTKLLSEVIAWMRQQPGSGSLKALLYIDEVFGYLPPVANPPSKEPLLVLLKQARAFGLGIVLASQNPIDVDYRALSNLGTWMLGRLQTQRDVARVVDGIRSAAAEQGEEIETSQLREMMAGLPKRTFLVRSPGQPMAKVKTRHTLSFLRGPMTLDEIGRLVEMPVPEWGPPPSLDEVLDDVDNLERESQEAISETRQLLNGMDPELKREICGDGDLEDEDPLVQAVAIPLGVLSRSSFIKPGDVDRAKGRLKRLQDNIAEADRLIEAGEYEAADRVWDTNPVIEPEHSGIPREEPKEEDDVGAERRLGYELEVLVEKRMAESRYIMWGCFLAGVLAGPVALMLVWMVAK